MGNRLIVSGPAACFRRPEFKVENISYDVLTPIAARRLFEAVHWTPSLWWRIERIEVLHPIRMDWRPISAGGSGDAAMEEGRSLCLIDVSYLVTARFELTATAGVAETAAQHAAMFKRRLRAQRFFRTPELGGRAFPATVRGVSANETPASAHSARDSVDLGWMVFDRDPSDRDRLRYFRPTMIDGVIDIGMVEASTLPC